MSLPKYEKTNRKKSFQQLPKDAYVVVIKDARKDRWPSGDEVIRIAFDIAEGDYKGFYQNQFDGNANEDKKWPMYAVFNLNVPNNNSQQYVWDNWHTFFADLEDSNSGFVFDTDKEDYRSLRGKLIGGKFYIKQREWNGNIYDSVLMKWTCVADDVRNGKAGKLPADKLLDKLHGAEYGHASPAPEEEWMKVPDGIENELPF